jgi:hypothetical protein
VKTWNGLRAGQQVSASEYTQVVRGVMEAFGSGGARVEFVNGRFHVYARPPPGNGFLVTVKEPTAVTVAPGYAVDGEDMTLYAELEVAVAQETFLFARYQVGVGWEEVGGHVVQAAAAWPAEDAAYVRYPLAHILWDATGQRIAGVKHYHRGLLLQAVGGYRAFFAKITGRMGSDYEFTEQSHDGEGVFADRAGGYEGTAREASGLAVDLAAGIIVPMVRVPDAEGADTFVFTLANWLAASSTVLPTDTGDEAEATVYTLPRTSNLEIPLLTRIHQEASKVALFMRTLKLDANGHPVELSAESKVVEGHILPDGTAEYDSPSWRVSTAEWVADLVRGHS